MSWAEFTDLLGNDLTQRGLRIAGVLLAAALLSRLLRRSATRIQGKVSANTTPQRNLQRTQTLTKIASSTGIVIIWILASIQILGILEYDLAPLLAGVGVIGLAVGFGAQNLVKDVVNGFFILLEDQYGIGDIIELNQEASGVVETLTLRVTGLRALDGTLHFISNSNITHVANRSMEWARALIDVGVAYKEDSARVRAVLEEVAQEAYAQESALAKLLYAEPEILGVEMLGEYEVVWRVKVDTKPGKQWEVSRALRERIKDAFDRAGIEIPFPHRVMVAADAARN